MGVNEEIPRTSGDSHRYEANRMLTRALGAAAVVSSGGLSGAQLAFAGEGGGLGGPKITDRVRLEVKIANYTEESIGANRGAKGSGDLVIGLYGEAAPQACRLFLDTVMGDGIELPSFYNAQFQRITPQGLLEMDKVRGVNEMNIAGSSQWEYKGNLLSNYKPILENNGLHHDRVGLLTHKQLSSTPEFSITLRDKKDQQEEDLKALDSFHCVFGEVLEGKEVLTAISEIPLYTYETSTGYAGGKKGVESELADKWFSAQREFYVNVGKSMGDQRAVDMRGKLLRRTVVKGAYKL
jgi:cyclophilin family peptidyl-prolyl cis-trans isomerase